MIDIDIKTVTQKIAEHEIPGGLHHISHLQRGGSVCLLSAQPPLLHNKVVHFKVFVWKRMFCRFIAPSEDDTASFASFKQTIEDDKAAGKKPLMCIANVHSTLFQKHSVSELSAMCKAQGLWLHLEGHALSALTLLPKSITCLLCQFKLRSPEFPFQPMRARCNEGTA